MKNNKDFKKFATTYFIPTPTERQNWMYDKIQEMREDIAKKEEQFFYEKMGLWKVLPKFLLKKVFILESKNHYGTSYQVLRNKITGKKFTFITEFAKGKK